jgi:hypothetical protein
MSKYGDRRGNPRGKDQRDGERFFIIVPNADPQSEEEQEFFELLSKRVHELNSEKVGGYTPIMLTGEPADTEIPLHTDLLDLAAEERLGSGSAAFVDLRGENWKQAWEHAKFLREQGMPVMLYTGETAPREVKKQYLAEEEAWSQHGRKESHCETFEPRYILLPTDEPFWVVNAIVGKLERHIQDLRHAVLVVNAA